MKRGSLLLLNHLRLDVILVLCDHDNLMQSSCFYVLSLMGDSIGSKMPYVSASMKRLRVYAKSR
jgi:hypothetical protein